MANASRIGDLRRDGDVLAGTYARLDHLCDRRRRLRPRHAVHARQRHRPRPTSPGGSAARSGDRSSASWPCPTTPACSPATTTGPTDASRAGRARSREQRAANTHWSGQVRGGVRRPPRSARRDPADAEADPARAAGEHPRRSAAGAGGERQALSQVPARRLREDGFVTEELTLRIGEALKVLANPTGCASPSSCCRASAQSPRSSGNSASASRPCRSSSASSARWGSSRPGGSTSPSSIA